MGARAIILAGLALFLVAAIVFVRVTARQQEMRAEAAFPPTGQLVEIDGLLTHIHVEGAGPDLVLIHGASGNTRDFTFSMSGKLAKDYRVIVIDRPGLGWSARLPKGRDGIAEQAAHLRKAAAHVGATRPLVLGQSYGAAVALAWAVNAPSELDGLIVVSGASHPWKGGLSNYYKVTSSRLGQWVVVPMMTAFVGKDRVNETLAEVFEPQSPPTGYGDYFGTGLTLRRASLKANADQRAVLKQDLIAQQPLYRDIAVPVEILHGTADTTVGFDIHARPLSLEIPDARLTPLEGQGHMPHHTAEDDVIDAVHRVAKRAGLR